MYISFEFAILFLDIYPNAITKHVKRGMHVDILHGILILVHNFLKSMVQS